MSVSIIHNNKTYIIEKKDDESNEIYSKRVEYIISKKENQNIDNIINLSYVWRNYMFYSMIYPVSLLKKL
jgi:hypothetical protein|uniref:XRN2-binding (XTBD) domain-containing protein n=1 Tax=viral metagenome TaxID=1070528 RepID=A0A6C0DYG0_9ZZZZ